MRKKRPCRICGKWFLPHKRAGNRQRVCSKKQCQRERHRRNCKQWHQNNPHYDREDRIKRKFVDAHDPEAPPQGTIDWEVVRDAVGLETSVIIEEISKVLFVEVRDAVRREIIEIISRSQKLPLSTLRDEIASASRSP